MKKNVTYRALSHKEMDLLIDASKVVELLYQTGVRISELSRVIDNYTIGQNYVDIKTKKSGEKTNRIWLTKRAMEILDSSDFTMRWVYVSTKTIQRHINDVSLNTGIIFTAHNIRATFATHLLGKGIDLVTVQTLMNHSDISTTAKYIQMCEDTLVNALKTLNQPDQTKQEMQKIIISQQQTIARLEKELGKVK